MINDLVFESLKKKITPEELHHHMDQFVYGRKHKNKYITPDDKEWDDFNHYVVQKPDELEKSHHGTCYDQSLYAYHHLHHMGYDPKIIFMMKKLKHGYNSHTTVIYHDHDGYRNFEHSWHKYSKIHVPHETYDDAVKEAYHRWLEGYKGEHELNTNVNAQELLNHPNLNMDNFHKIVSKNSKIVKS